MPTPEEQKQLDEAKAEGIKYCKNQADNSRVTTAVVATAATLYIGTTGGLGRLSVPVVAPAVAAATLLINARETTCLKNEGLSEEEIKEVQNPETDAEKRAKLRASLNELLATATPSEIEAIKMKAKAKAKAAAAAAAPAPAATPARVATPMPAVTFSSPSPNFARQSDFGRSITQSQQVTFSNFVSSSMPSRADTSLSFSMPSSSSSSLNYTPAPAPTFNPSRFSGGNFGGGSSFKW